MAQPIIESPHEAALHLAEVARQKLGPEWNITVVRGGSAAGDSSYIKAGTGKWGEGIGFEARISDHGAGVSRSMEYEFAATVDRGKPLSSVDMAHWESFLTNAKKAEKNLGGKQAWEKRWKDRIDKAEQAAETNKTAKAAGYHTKQRALKAVERLRQERAAEFLKFSAKGSATKSRQPRQGNAAFGRHNTAGFGRRRRTGFRRDV